MQKLIASVLMFFTLLGLAPANENATPLPIPYHPDIFVNFDYVRKIRCFDAETKTGGVGTGFLIAPNILVTADHVLDKKCWDVRSSKEVVPYHIDKENDFALLRFESGISPDRDFMDYSCGGFIAGEEYSAIGYKGGNPLVMTKLHSRATKAPADYKLRSGTQAGGMRILNGDIFQGMSGGPIVDRDGTVIGINSATDHKGVGLSREIKDTILCAQAPSSASTSLRLK